MNRALGHLWAHIYAKLGQENLLRMVTLSSQTHDSKKKPGVKGSGANHYPKAPAQYPNSHTLEVVDRAPVRHNYLPSGLEILINPSRPHDALKHHFSSLKYDLIS